MSDELKKKAFDFASDTTKQLITIATALIALSITFLDSLGGSGSKVILLLCWIALFLSVLFGVATLMALTGTLEKCTEKDDPIPLSIYGLNVKRPSFLQILFFLLGLFLLAVFGSQSLSSDEPNLEPDQVEVLRRSTYEIVNPERSDTLVIQKEGK